MCRLISVLYNLIVFVIKDRCPAVGDFRSRCLRLSDQSTAEALAVRRLLGHRLPLNASQAKSEWMAVIRGQNEISHPTNGTMPPVNKGCSSVPALPARIKRVFYMSSEGGNSLHEVFPTVNSSVLDQLSNVDCIVYAMGSLFTSICPSLSVMFLTIHEHDTTPTSSLSHTMMRIAKLQKMG
ncbi:hypothetical protein GH714_003567 [Hevea brasiliensis]|uniref:Uncharacterized protein n=1 Tax=Hevea brasiliensis TaxID=3981 RepID=A0A6A6LV58_HEVBR|nr:hypothetical protein GH714_003567 [Hevea brasiliensis]